jgi:hypothetical protein
MWSILFYSLAISYSISIAASAQAFAQNAKQLDCQCIAASGLCNFKLFDEAAGKPRQSWSQPIYFTDSEPSAQERALACWRKREVGGQGLCCSLNNDETDATRYFKGDIN